LAGGRKSVDEFSLLKVWPRIKILQFFGVLRYQNIRHVVLFAAGVLSLKGAWDCCPPRSMGLSSGSIETQGCLCRMLEAKHSNFPPDLCYNSGLQEAAAGWSSVLVRLLELQVDSRVPSKNEAGDSVL
jgi:hypothetical protein